MVDKELVMERYNHSLIQKLFYGMRTQCSEETFKIYETPIREFFFNFMDFDFVTLRDIKSIKVSHANEWIYQLKKDGNKNSTINRMASSLFWFYKNLSHNQDLDIQLNPFSTDCGANRLKESRVSKGVRISDEKLQDLNTYFSNKRTWLGERDYIMYLIFITTGMRKTEVRTLQIGDFYDYGDKFAVRFTAKGDNFNVAEIPQGIKHLLQSFMFRSGWDWSMREQYVFPPEDNFSKPLSSRRVGYVFEDAFEAVGLPKTTRIHDLRHTYITKSLEMGLDIYDISKRVGHANIGTTRKYDHSFRIFNDNPAETFFEELNEKSQQNYPELRIV